MVLSVFMLLFGWRWLRYSSAGLSISCLSLTCDLVIYPIGFVRPVKLSNLHRDQIANVMAVKTQRDGTFVTDRNIVLMDPYVKKKGKKKQTYQKSSSYKGPDENGNYLSYAIILQKKEQSNSEQESNESNILGETISQVDLTPLLPYVDSLESTASDTADIDPSLTLKQYRLIPRKFGTRHNQRRVRGMVQKIEGYIKHRRQKLVIHENAAPAWQGIVLIVLGATTLLITIALGQFYDEEVVKGPGVRRKEQLKKHNPSPSSTIAKRKLVVQNANQIATPMQYEVQTVATKPPPPPLPKDRGPDNPNLSYRRAVASAHAQSRVTR